MKVDKSNRREAARHKRQHGMRVRKGGLIHIQNAIVKRSNGGSK